MVVHLVVAKVVIPVVMGFSGPLSVTVTSDPLAVTDLVLEISGTDPDMFILARAKVPTFRDPFRFLEEIQFFSLTSLFHFPIHTWLHPVFYLLLLFSYYQIKKLKKIKFF